MSWPTKKPPGGVSMTPFDDPRTAERTARMTDAELAQHTTSVIIEWATLRRDKLIAALDRGLDSDNEVAAARLALSVASYLQKVQPQEPVVQIEAHVTSADYVDTE